MNEGRFGSHSVKARARARQVYGRACGAQLLVRYPVPRDARC